MAESSFIAVDANSHFPLQNLPYGIFQAKGTGASPRVGVAIGDQVLDLAVLTEAGLFSSCAPVVQSQCFQQASLNAFMQLGRPVWRQVRAILVDMLRSSSPILRDNAELRAKALIPQAEVEMLLPAQVGDYTDFYASREHATNIGTMWRGKDDALMPNWLWIPVGYHGRSSSVVVSGTPVRRPSGQTRNDPSLPPVHGPSKVLDFELEMGLLVGPGNTLGDPIPLERAEDHIFGVVLLNDWSARDLQKWEYQPLGPFTAKNFATTISPWVVTLDALEPFRTQGPAQNDPEPLPYLRDTTPSAYDIQLTVGLQNPRMKQPQVVCSSNLKYLYWSMKQQLVHHAVSGCNMRPGDLLGSGTISGPTPDSYGSLLEITWGGKNAFTLTETGEEHKYLQDGDTVVLEGFCQGQGYRVGFGQCTGTILPAHT